MHEEKLGIATRLCVLLKALSGPSHDSFCLRCFQAGKGPSGHSLYLRRYLSNLVVGRDTAPRKQQAASSKQQAEVSEWITQTGSENSTARGSHGDVACQALLWSSIKSIRLMTTRAQPVAPWALDMSPVPTYYDVGGLVMGVARTTTGLLLHVPGTVVSVLFEEAGRQAVGGGGCGRVRNWTR